jgi:signal transduction histidine kinase
VTLHWDLAPARTRGDARLLERLAGNLIDNGLRYNHAGGRVEVHTGEADGRALLRVSNSGPRLDPDGVARLLEPFERGGRAGDGGAGLGLSIVRAIAEAHDGAVSLRARDAGGLDVEVALPRA